MKISLLSRSGPEILQSMLKGDEEHAALHRLTAG